MFLFLRSHLRKHLPGHDRELLATSYTLFTEMEVPGALGMDGRIRKPASFEFC